MKVVSFAGIELGMDPSQQSISNGAYVAQMFYDIGTNLSFFDVEMEIFCGPGVKDNIRSTNCDKVTITEFRAPFSVSRDILKNASYGFIWNGATERNLIKSLRHYGLPLVFAEMGFIPQNENIFFDWEGAGPNSSFAKSKVMRPGDKFLFEKFRALYCAQSRYDAPDKDIVYLVADQPILFVPLQMESDSNITSYSPYKKMSEFVKDIVSSFPDHIIVARPHPRQKDVKVDLRDRRLIVTNTGSLAYWLDRSAIVCGVNSTSLIEALLFLKPTISVGEGVGKNKGVYVATPERITPSVAAELNCSVDYSRICDFIMEIILHRQISMRNMRSDICLRQSDVFRSIIDFR